MQFTPVTISECPSCKSIVGFKNTGTNFIVCHVCGTALFRQDAGILVEKPVATSFIKSDFIQPGTTGRWKGEPFTVLGRFRAFFEEAAFNYWTIEWESKQIAYLAEGYGLFAILHTAPFPEKANSHSLNKMKNGSLVDLLPLKDFILEKDQPVLQYEAEGEFFLPFPEKNFTVYDFAAKDGTKFTIFDFKDDKVVAFESQPATLKELKLENTRSVAAVPKNYTCTQCSNAIVVKTFPYAQSFACLQCGSFYQLDSNGTIKKIHTPGSKEIPAITPGTTGVINNITYEVLGYAQKQEKNIYKSKWREYTLYNPQEGYAFLSEFDGHWIFLRENIDAPVLFYNKEKDFLFNQKEFRLFNSYKYKVIHAGGEFPYNIFDNTETDCCEYICPPEIWIQEKDNKEGIRWFFGQHISSREVASAFTITDMPYRKGVGAVQPGSMSTSKLIFGVFIGLLCLLLANYLTNTGKREQLLFDEDHAFADTSNILQVVTPRYELDKRRSNLRFDIYADVSNSWFELSATLVNVKTGKEYNLEKGVEYYYGYSEGESWTEGSTREVAYFTRIPAGTYFLELQGAREGGTNRASHFNVKITYDVPSMRNLWIVLILFFTWPIIKYLMIRYTETARWRNSPYAPQQNTSNYEED